MTKQQRTIVLVSITYFIALAGMSVQLSGDIEQLRQEAIERGFAIYCPQTGQFAWKDECGLKS